MNRFRGASPTPRIGPSRGMAPLEGAAFAAQVACCGNSSPAMIELTRGRPDQRDAMMG